MNFALSLVSFALLSAGSANYHLSCDDDNIFEGPLTLVIDGTKASADGQFSGPGDAIFTVRYKNVAVSGLQSDEDHALKAVTLSRAGFRLSLKAEDNGDLRGKVSMVSTDSDHMPYDGEITCTVE